MDPLSQVFCLRWNNHRNNLLSVFDHLLQTEAFCDVTLACDGSSIKCHKMILSACSSYFQSLFMENSCEHPIVFLKDIKYGEIRAILDYMYKGEVNVAQEELPGLLKVAELLKVKGLVEEEREKLLSCNNKDGRSLVSQGSDEPFRDKKINGNSKGDDLRFASAYSSSPGNGLPLWPLPGIFPGSLFSAPQNSGNGDSEKESSPGGSKRKKMIKENQQQVLQQQQQQQHHHHHLIQQQQQQQQPSSGDKNSPSNSSPKDESSNELTNRHDMEEDKESGNLDKSGIANYVPNQRLEWKRYKQYTRNDIMAAIDEVRKGMSALQASRKFGVPSRTLYDKVKKMGITTGRQMQRKSIPTYPTSFPSLNSISEYKDITDRMKEQEESNDGADVDNGRPSLVPPSFPPYMLNLMEKIKEADRNNTEKVELTPMNLSTMLSSASSREGLKRSSEGSGSQSPSSGEVEGEIRAQFMADLRRLGGKLPPHSSSSNPATSSTPPGDSLSTCSSNSLSDGQVSPPLILQSNNLLPPRKRKMSQDNHLQALLTAAAAVSAAEKEAASKTGSDYDKHAQEVEDDEEENDEENEDKLTLMILKNPEIDDDDDDDGGEEEDQENGDDEEDEDDDEEHNEDSS